MTVTPLAEASKYPVGTTVQAVKAQIVEVSKQFSGESEHGPWSLQNVTIQDPSGKLKCKFKNRAALAREWKGVWVYICCTIDGKNKSNGLSIQEDVYRGITNTILQVNEHAELTEAAKKDAGTASGAPQAPASPQVPASAQAAPAPPQAAPVQPSGPPSAQSAPQRPQNGVTPGGKEDQAASLKKAKFYLARAAVAMELSFDAALYMAGRLKAKHGVDLPIAEMEKIAVSFSIGLQREGLADGLPLVLPEEKKEP